MALKYEELSKEQQQFVNYATQGHNILVDACIGSGKTTAIQTLCSFARNKRILYLTYNKLLKLDAQDRIRNGMVNVTNYHGFAYSELLRMNVRPGLSELIQVYNRKKPPVTTPYDVLILDEYQDIEQEIADMLVHVKNCCPGIQIIAVGDMAQKIYDKTRLDVQPFITKFLGNYIPMEFTVCFRLGEAHAAMLGRVWNKTIVGVNEGFEIRRMFDYDIREYTSKLEPRQLLVLGSRTGKAQDLQNHLETWHSEKYNKKTLWSKIRDGEGATSPTPDCAIFTTYDGCKGMEREVCVLYDWSYTYWEMRLSKPETKYEIIRNIFCVAASRGKRLLILAETDFMLEEDDLSNPDCCNVPYEDMGISDMFDYKYVEDVEDAYFSLDVQEIRPEGEEIRVPNSDSLIDLSPCIGNYQEAMYFKNYDIDQALEYQLSCPDRSHMRKSYKKYNLDQKLLYLATLETKQNRYMNQVIALPITSENRDRIRKRLSGEFPEDAHVQVPCSLPFFDGRKLLFTANGVADVVHDDIVYELKFVSALSHVHILQAAMYMACMGYAVGRLWNVRTDQMLEIRIPDRQDFLNKAAKAVTKGRILEYQVPVTDLCEQFFYRHHEVCQEYREKIRGKKKFSIAGVENYFRKRGLQIPVPAKDFVKYIKRLS